MKKLFVVDTNVVLFDHTCVYNFQEHDVALSVVVLEELDRFKRGNDLINLEARQFIRELDELAGDGPLTEGLPLGDGRGRLYVEVGEPTPTRVSRAFALSKPDHRILALADELRERRPDREVILVSKDVNLRIKAKSLGLLAEDYTTGKVRHVDRLYSGTACWEGLSSEVIARLHQEPHAVPLLDFPDRGALLPNQYLVMRNGSLSALAHHNRLTGTLERVTKRTAYGVEPRNAEQIFALDALLRPEVQLLTMTGRAGTGKTLLALAAALEQRRLYHQIYLARPVVPLGNRDIGFL
ncbi:MAG TPA: PIN domain-containing protein, partial [Vicinamibacteria bacterium]|nr:PIN domain-containing protein [Vicinamibacteria bacterium]